MGLFLSVLYFLEITSESNTWTAYLRATVKYTDVMNDMILNF